MGPIVLGTWQGSPALVADKRGANNRGLTSPQAVVIPLRCITAGRRTAAGPLAADFRETDSTMVAMTHKKAPMIPPTDPGTPDNDDASQSSELPVEKPEPTIHLDQFLKTCGVATGGQAKVMIQAGEVLVNDEVETRRRRQLRVGDEVTLDDVIYVVSLGEE